MAEEAVILICPNGVSLLSEELVRWAQDLVAELDYSHLITSIHLVL